MKSQKSRVDGAFTFTPPVYPDHRGFVLVPFHEDAFVAAVGHPLFPVTQTCYSRSRRGAIRGLHYTATPPGIAKYVYCAQGAVLDMVVDTRVGSPTFGEWDSVLLDQDTFTAMYLPVGVGHAYQSLVDGSVVHYMLSERYNADHEMALAPLDTALGLPFSSDIEPILSERDRTARTLAEAEAAGLLPEYARCLEIEAAFGSRSSTAHSPNF